MVIVMVKKICMYNLTSCLEQNKHVVSGNSHYTVMIYYSPQQRKAELKLRTNYYLNSANDNSVLSGYKGVGDDVTLK